MVNYFYQQKILSFSAGIMVILSVNTFKNGTFTTSSHTPRKVSQLLETALAFPEFRYQQDSSEISLTLSPDTRPFYDSTDFQLAWLTPEKPLPQADSLMAALEQASTEGLDSNQYYLPEIRRLRQETYKSYLKLYDFEKLSRLDVLLTDAYLQYAKDLYTGSFVPAADTTWLPRVRKQDLTAYLQKALDANTIRKSLQDLLPTYPAYRQLKMQLAVYQKIVKKGGWQRLPTDKALKLKQGMADSVVFALKNHLLFTRDYWTPGKPDSLYDEKLTAALKRYQARHNLEPNGKLDKATIQQLNLPAEDFAKRIALNMERFKWLPPSFGENHVLVNIPDFTLSVYEKNSCKVMDMRVIVGRNITPTPVFSDTMEHLIFSPEWSVPLSIARKEMLPILRQAPHIIEAQGIHVYKDWGVKAKLVSMYDINWDDLKPTEFNYRLVAKSGGQNPLGFVTFQFPNPMHIYLHDTPFDGLFQIRKRDFSHGCIRIQYPGHLAKFALEGDTSWTRNKLIEYSEKPNPVKVNLQKKKIFVHLTYQTAFVDEAGKLQFREDIYRHDARQIKAIETARRRARYQRLITRK